MTTTQEAPAQTNAPVKVSTYKGKGGNDRRVPRYFSDKDTPPISDVLRDGKLIAGISENQKIAEGYRPPLAWQPERDKEGNTIGRFQKTEKEREELKKVHTNTKGPSGGGKRSAGRGDIKSTLIIHRVNVHRKKYFITTISLQVYPAEVNLHLGKYHDPIKHKLVLKYHYRGKTKEIGD